MGKNPEINPTRLLTRDILVPFVSMHSYLGSLRLHIWLEEEI